MGGKSKVLKRKKVTDAGTSVTTLLRNFWSLCTWEWSRRVVGWLLNRKRAAVNSGRRLRTDRKSVHWHTPMWRATSRRKPDNPNTSSFDTVFTIMFFEKRFTINVQIRICYFLLFMVEYSVINLLLKYRSSSFFICWQETTV